MMSYYPASQNHPSRQADYPHPQSFPPPQAYYAHHQGYLPHQTSPQQAGNGARNRTLLIAFGIVFAIIVLAALVAGSDSSGYSESGYDDSSYSDSGYYPEESGGSSQIYGDSGSITTTEDGELIYSDSNGNSLSTGG
jgi:hypothetical protein